MGNAMPLTFSGLIPLSFWSVIPLAGRHPVDES
jgi:hypothetical protein